MKTDYLKGLGITEQKTIDAIMAENGKDIENAKKDYETISAKVTGLETQLTDRNNQLNELKKSVKDNEQLTAKITELEKTNADATTKYQNDIAQIHKTHAIENGVRDAKAKNNKAVIALLDMEKITMKDGVAVGLKEQLDALTAGEDTKFLFGESTPSKPAGSEPGNPPADPNKQNPPSGKSFTDSIAAALNSNK